MYQLNTLSFIICNDFLRGTLILFGREEFESMCIPILQEKGPSCTNCPNFQNFNQNHSIFVEFFAKNDKFEGKENDPFIYQYLVSLFRSH